MRLPFSAIRGIRRWAYRYIQQREPDFVIGAPSDPYLRRWHILKTPLAGIYIHQFVRSDDPRALHDHPWPSVSLILDGYYGEMVRTSPSLMFWRHPGDVVFRGPRARHRIVLDRPRCGKPYPVLTLFLVGPRVREWGFWCPKGFVPWREFCAPSNMGQIGKGCGE